MVQKIILKGKETIFPKTFTWQQMTLSFSKEIGNFPFKQEAALGNQPESFVEDIYPKVQPE